MPESLIIGAAGAFANAPFQPNGWDTALKIMAKATGLARGQIIAVRGSEAIPLNLITDADPEEIAELPVVGGADPKRSWRVASSGAPMEIINESHYIRARPTLDCGAYDELCDRLDMVHGAQTVLHMDGGTMYGIATLRTRADGVSSDEQLSMFAQLAPFAKGAVQLQSALANEGAKLLLGSLDAMSTAVFLCDRSGRIFGHTRKADEFLAAGIVQLLGGELRANERSFSSRLMRAIGAALDKGVPAAGASGLWLPASDLPGHGNWFEVFPLPRREWPFSFDPCAMVVVRSPHTLGADPHSVKHGADSGRGGDRAGDDERDTTRADCSGSWRFLGDGKNPAHECFQQSMCQPGGGARGLPKSTVAELNALNHCHHHH